MNEHTRLTIDDLKARYAHVEKQAVEIKQAIRVLLDLEGVPIVPLPTQILPPGPLLHDRLRLEDKGKNRRKNIPAPGGQGRKRGRKNPFSQFEGVYNGKLNAKGQQRYLASVWVDGKNKGLGSFQIEEEAAAAVQKAKGNKAEAKRLLEIARQKAADLLEQAENNPNRAPGRRKAEDGKQTTQEAEPELTNLGGLPPAGHTACAWKCNRCGTQHLQAEQPKVCRECFKNHGFSEISKFYCKKIAETTGAELILHHEEHEGARR